MPIEFSRTTKNKKILLPNSGTGGDGSSILIPIITNISFIDPVRRGQETRFTLDNSAQANRTVHVDDVYPSGDTTQQPLKVERIDKWDDLDIVRRSQERKPLPDNKTGSDRTPPSFITHLKKHVLRYYSDPNNPSDTRPWVDSELIDKFAFVDPVRRYQETAWTLVNTDKQADPNDPDITDSNNGVDPPWRTDWFQNIVDWGPKQQSTQSGLGAPGVGLTACSCSGGAAGGPDGGVYAAIAGISTPFIEHQIIIFDHINGTFQFATSGGEWSVIGNTFVTGGSGPNVGPVTGSLSLGGLSATFTVTGSSGTAVAVQSFAGLKWTSYNTGKSYSAAQLGGPYGGDTVWSWDIWCTPDF